MGSIAARNAHAAIEDCVTTSQDSASVWLDTVATGKADTQLVKISFDLISVIIPLSLKQIYHKSSLLPSMHNLGLNN